MIKDIHPDKEGLTEQVENAPPARTETHHVSKVTAQLIKPVLGRSHGLATRLQQSPNLFHNLALLLPSRNLTLDPQSQLIRPLLIIEGRSIVVWKPGMDMYDLNSVYVASRERSEDSRDW